MARSGVEIDEVLAAPGLRVGDVHDRLIEAMAVDGEYHTAQVGSDRFQFARTYRPTWAIVAACCTVWLALLGLLFLLVKATETCLAVVDSDHRGARLRLQGRIRPAALGRVRAAMASPTEAESVARVPSGFAPPSLRPETEASRPVVRSAAPMVATTGAEDAARAANDVPFAVPPDAAPSRSDGALREPHTVARSLAGSSRSDDGVAPPTPEERSRPALRAVLDDGTELSVSTLTLIGRDPAPAPGEDASLVALDDWTRSVSKTHLSLLDGGDALVVLDRNSTNGVLVIGPDGAEVTLEAGTPARAEPGSVVRFGERELRVVGSPEALRGGA